MADNKNLRYIRIYNKDISKMLIFPDQNTNKYSRGKCIVVAGSKKFPGAAILTSKACERSGCGYTMLYTNKNSIVPAAFTMPSIPVDDYFLLQDSDLLQTNNDKPVAYVVGPGFVPDLKKNKDILLNILNSTNAPIIIDGGALSCISYKSIRKALTKRNKQGKITILSPHLGEAKKIYSYYSDKKLNKSLRTSTFVFMLSELTSSLIVLKGPNTYICDGEKAYLMRKGTEALAKAGSGDVLAGIIGGFVCQNKKDAFDACIAATIVHAEAGSLAAKDLSTISVCAHDLIEYIPKAILQIKRS